jgi:hypothetical protein
LILVLVFVVPTSPVYHPRVKLRKQKHKINGPIKTVVVVVMENRSFDHVLGWLKATRPDIDGLTGEDAVVANTLFAKHMPKRSNKVTKPISSSCTGSKQILALLH